MENTIILTQHVPNINKSNEESIELVKSIHKTIANSLPGGVVMIIQE